MYADMYYLLTAFAFVFFFFNIYFTWDEMIKVDSQGREYDAFFFIVMILGISSIILNIVLAMQSWNIETLYVVGNQVQTYTSEDLGYFLAVHLFLFFATIAMMIYKAFEFFISSVEKAEYKKKKERFW